MLSPLLIPKCIVRIPTLLRLRRQEVQKVVAGVVVDAPANAEHKRAV